MREWQRGGVCYDRVKVKRARTSVAGGTNYRLLLTFAKAVVSTKDSMCGYLIGEEEVKAEKEHFATVRAAP